ncbi:hypothetical protein Catovirus_2_266 [Catovirus CTV1]|uniref:t-SNARE coiled-coil homology domain-containing protein n=1 Tax=Catovirus CTV1 TaxID=1977631 RepID=A0A1V0SC81_9VIRU|nr:hypothetical protein Catovirus_2_266 [Catovirus CTV1]
MYSDTFNKQDQLLQLQDEVVEKLLVKVENLHSVSKEINTELKIHNKLLSNLEEGIDKNKNALSKGNRNLKKLEEKALMCGFLCNVL